MVLPALSTVSLSSVMPVRFSTVTATPSRSVSEVVSKVWIYGYPTVTSR